MLIGNHNTNERVLIIAEVGNNHEGDVNLAMDMIAAAAEGGADAVKFQTIKPEYLVNRSNKERFDKLKSFELSYEQFEKLSEKAAECGVMFLSTPCDLKSAEFLNKIVPAFKIASSDNTFYPLMEKVASFGKPVLLSCGLASIAEIKQAKNVIENIWKENSVEGVEVALLHCILSYPAAEEDINLNIIKTFQEEFGGTIGYSDHALGIDVLSLAVAAGARIIEKHFTIDKNYSDFRDHQLSADVDDLKKIVKDIRKVEKIMGSPLKKVQKGEEPMGSVVRRSLVACQDIPAGKIINLDDIKWLRPADGIPAGQEKLIVGKKAKTAIKQDDVFTVDMVE